MAANLNAPTRVIHAEGTHQIKEKKIWFINQFKNAPLSLFDSQKFSSFCQIVLSCEILYASFYNGIEKQLFRPSWGNTSQVFVESQS